MSEAAIEVFVDGKLVRVAPGTSVAAAILNAPGSDMAMRSSVRGEARSALCGMGICFECRVTIDGVAHERSCQKPCRAGMRIETLGAAAWMTPSPRSVAHSVETDVAVVGAGPAGVAAACCAAEQGARVLLLDDNPEAGGQIWRHNAQQSAGAEGAPRKRAWLERLERAGVTVSKGTSVVDVGREGAHCLQAWRPSATGDEALEIQYGKLVLATGARERFLPFPGWTTPGVVGVGGLQALMKGGFDLRGKRVAFAGSGPLMLAVAAAVRAAGADIVVLAEHAKLSSAARLGPGLALRFGKLRQLLDLRRTIGRRVRYGWMPRRVRVRGDELVLELSTRSERKMLEVACDLVATGFGLVPEQRLAALLGCRMSAAHDAAIQVDELQRTDVDACFAAGECTGVGGVDLALVEGQIAGFAAAGREDLARTLQRERARELRWSDALERSFGLGPELRRLPTPDTTVCRCEDVSFEAAQDRSGPRHAKLQERCGMGPCQGRVCQPAMRWLCEWAESDRVRAPLFPVPMSMLSSSASAEDAQGSQPSQV